MKIPEKIKVGAMIYDVVIVPNMYTEYSLYGELITSNQVIRIAGDISERRQFNAFIHELYHAIKFEAGQVDQDEKETLAVSNMMTQVFLDNHVSFCSKSEVSIE